MSRLLRLHSPILKPKNTSKREFSAKIVCSARASTNFSHSSCDNFQWKEKKPANYSQFEQSRVVDQGKPDARAGLGTREVCNSIKNEGLSTRPAEQSPRARPPPNSGDLLIRTPCSEIWSEPCSLRNRIRYCSKLGSGLLPGKLCACYVPNKQESYDHWSYDIIFAQQKLSETEKAKKREFEATQ